MPPHCPTPVLVRQMGDGAARPGLQRHPSVLTSGRSNAGGRPRGACRGAAGAGDASGPPPSLLRGGPLLTPERRRPFAHRLFLMHKPQNCQSERLKPGDARLSVYDVVARAGIDLPSSSLGCFGRLDANTTGLLLMGTDGGLQSLLMHPSSGCEKAYVATLRVLPAARLP